MNRSRRETCKAVSYCDPTGPGIDNRPHEQGIRIPMPVPHDATELALVERVVDFALNLDGVMTPSPDIAGISPHLHADVPPTLAVSIPSKPRP